MGDERTETTGFTDDILGGQKMFVDSHIHLSYYLFNQKFPYIDYGISDDAVEYTTRENMIERMRAEGIEFCVEPGIDLASNALLLSLSEKHKGFILPVVGVHPTRTPETKWSGRKEIERLSEREDVAGIGELGLDYHYERKKQHGFRQKMWFRWQLRLAHKRALPLVLHIRDADRDAIRILRRYKKKLHGGVCHCFNSDAETARIYTEELGLMLGIGGSILQKPCYIAALEEAVRQTPLEYILLETDAPYVKPTRPEGISKKQWRKIRNTSLLIPLVAKRVAELKGVEVSEVERITTENARRLFLRQ